MNDTVQKIQIDYVSSGADRAASDYDRVTAAQSRLSALEQQATVIRETATRSQINASTALDRYTQRLDPLSKALADVERGERLVATARSQGLSVTSATERALAAAHKRHKDLEAALNDNSLATSLNRTQMMMFESAISNTASSLGSGASAMQVFMQQGPDLVQAFGMGNGGVGGTLKGIKDMLAGIITPARLAGGALAGAGILAAMSFANARSEQAALFGSTIGAGRGTGLTMSGLNAAATQGAAASGGYLSLSGARGATVAMVSSGLVDRSIIGGAVGHVERFAQLAGHAAKLLSTAFADPSKGAVELDKSLGFLNDRLAQTIKSLQDSGDAAGAQKALFDAFDASIKGAAASIDKNRGAFSRIWAGISTAVSNADSALGDRMNGPSAQDQVATLRRELDQAKRGIFSGNVSRRVLAENPCRIAELEKQISDEARRADANRKDVSDNRLSMLGGATIRKYAPEAQSLKELQDAREQLRLLITDAEALAKTGVSAEHAATAFQRLNTAIVTFESPLQKVANDSAIAARQTMAYTFAEREAVAAESARLNALRSSKDTLVAAAEAEAARNRLIAEGNAQAKAYARQSADELRLSSLRPYERARQQVMLDSKNFADQYVPTGGASSVAAYIQQSAAARGIDPNVALRVAMSEGLRSYSGDGGSSFGPFQLHYGGIAKGGNAVGGLGDVFSRITGLDARNPMTTSGGRFRARFRARLRQEERLVVLARRSEGWHRQL